MIRLTRLLIGVMSLLLCRAVRIVTYPKVRFRGNRTASIIAAGIRHSLALKKDRSVAAWGDNDEGQCDIPSPNKDFMAVAAGFFHSLGLKADGSIVAWGANGYGQADVPAPNADFVAIAAGDWHNLGLKTDGSIVAWGWNRYNQCDVSSCGPTSRGCVRQSVSR